jgi:hypothetical protein
MMLSLLHLDPADYRPSDLHRPDRTFRETNCYADLWIELLHAHGIIPESAMGCACTVDFEGDQWTFFKPPPGDLLGLHGIDVHEMQLYRPVPEHIAEQLQAGRTMTLEADAFYLPDTAGTSYRRHHVKSSIAVEGIEADGERLRYFHGAGYYELNGADYRGALGLTGWLSEDALPPYVEVVNFHAGPRLAGEHLRRAALGAFRRQMVYRPRRNPWLAFGERLMRDLPELLSGPDSGFHAYAFATVRQCGAAFEIACSFVRWLAPATSADACLAGEALSRQVEGAKTLLFKLARRREFDPAPAIARLAMDWDIAMNALDGLALSAEGIAA